MKVRVRRRKACGVYSTPYVVEYKNGWWPFWFHSRDFVIKEWAVKYAKELIEDQTIKIT